MSIQGFIVDLSCHDYQTPGCCSSCMGPRQTEVEARFSQKIGNIRTTLKMPFPYCDACAKRARRERVREIVVVVMAILIGGGLGFVAWQIHVGVGVAIRFALALPLGTAIAVLCALATRQSLPAAPATARGEAVILRDTNGTVLCTNPQFAQLLAEANGRAPRPGVQRLTAEVWAALGALMFGVLVLSFWIKDGAREGTAVAAAATSAPVAAKVASAPAASAPTPAQPTQPKKVAPATAPAAKKH
jgi:hypothetical protein